MLQVLFCGHVTTGYDQITTEGTVYAMRNMKQLHSNAVVDANDQKKKKLTINEYY